MSFKDETTAEVAKLAAEVDNYKSKEILALVNEAIRTGKISNANSGQFLKLSFETAKEIIDNLPARTASLSDELKTLRTTESVKTYEWYLKNDKEGLKKLSRENPTLYKQIELAYNK